MLYSLSYLPLLAAITSGYLRLQIKKEILRLEAIVLGNFMAHDAVLL